MLAAIDLETTGLNPRKDMILSWAAAWENGKTEFHLWDIAASSRIQEIIDDPNNEVVGHNIKFDAQFIESAIGRKIPRGLRIYDTLLLAWLLNENEPAYNLHDLCLKYIGVDLKRLTDYGIQGQLFEKVEGVETKCIQDVEATLLLYRTLRTRLTSFPAIEKVYEKLYCPLIRVVMEMEQTGMPVNRVELDRLNEEWEKGERAAKDAFHAIVGWPLDPGKNIQVSKWLFGEAGLLPKKFMVDKPDMWRTKTGVWKVDKEVLAEYDDHPAVQQLLLWRKYAKWRSGYAEKWCKYAAEGGGRIHTHFFQVRSPREWDDDENGTGSGRWASGDPINLFTIPKSKPDLKTEPPCRLKSAIVAPSGYSIIYADYSQLELRILAHASGDPTLIKAYKDGLDIHKITMEGLGISNRTLAKNANFGLSYKIGARKFSRQLWTKARVRLSEEDSRRTMDGWYRLYSGVPAYQDRVARVLAARGYVETLLGRRKTFSREDMNVDQERCNRQAINETIQGTAADIAGIAMWEMWQKKSDLTRFFLHVYDSLALLVRTEEAEGEKAKLKHAMEDMVVLKVPLVACIGIGQSLEEAETNAH